MTEKKDAGGRGAPLAHVGLNEHSNMTCGSMFEHPVTHKLRCDGVDGALLTGRGWLSGGFWVDLGEL